MGFTVGGDFVPSNYTDKLTTSLRTHQLKLARIAASSNRKGSVSPMVGGPGAQLPGGGGGSPSRGGPLPSPGMGPYSGGMKSSAGAPTFDKPPRKRKKLGLGGY